MRPLVIHTPVTDDSSICDVIASTAEIVRAQIAKIQENRNVCGLAFGPVFCENGECQSRGYVITRFHIVR